MGLQESLRAQDSAIQKPDRNRNKMSHSLYNHPYVLNHIQLVNVTFDNYEDIKHQLNNNNTLGYTEDTWLTGNKLAEDGLCSSKLQ